jgi:hypothetical protein
MKRTLLVSAIATVLVLGSTHLTVTAQGNGNGSGANTEKAQLVGGILTEQDKLDLRYLREEEKLARDTYLTLTTKWNLVVFKNISDSEQRHTDSVSQLLTAYQLPDPALPDVGRFQNTELQNLYTDLIIRGSQSANEALLVGALVEEVDIADLQKMLGLTKNPDLISTYGKLLQASYRHLNSFAHLWTAQTGLAYKPQLLSQSEVERILSCSPLTVGNNLQIHIPNLKYKNMNLWATLDYVPNTIVNKHVFQVSDYGINTTANCTSATLAPLDLSLKTPQATFKFYPSSDGKIYFSLDQYTP